MANFTSHMLLVFFSLIFVDRSNFCLDTSKLISFPHLTKLDYGNSCRLLLFYFFIIICPHHLTKFRCFNVLIQSLSENANMTLNFCDPKQKLTLAVPTNPVSQNVAYCDELVYHPHVLALFPVKILLVINNVRMMMMLMQSHIFIFICCFLSVKCSQ